MQLYLIWSCALRILVLDDETDFGSAVRQYLERDGYSVIEAADGRRQSVPLTNTFAKAFYAHIDEAVRKITEIPPQP